MRITKLKKGYVEIDLQESIVFHRYSIWETDSKVIISNGIFVNCGSINKIKLIIYFIGWLFKKYPRDNSKRISTISSTYLQGLRGGK